MTPAYLPSSFFTRSLAAAAAFAVCLITSCDRPAEMTLHVEMSFVASPYLSLYEITDVEPTARVTNPDDFPRWFIFSNDYRKKRDPWEMEFPRLGFYHPEIPPWAPYEGDWYKGTLEWQGDIDTNAIYSFEWVAWYGVLVPPRRTITVKGLTTRIPVTRHVPSVVPFLVVTTPYIHLDIADRHEDIRYIPCCNDTDVFDFEVSRRSFPGVAVGMKSINHVDLPGALSIPGQGELRYR